MIFDMYFADSLHGWVVGAVCKDTLLLNYLVYNSGIILETFDGGENWLPVVENLSARLKAIHFKDGYGWAVGDNGLILKTDGSTWIDQKSGQVYPSKYRLSQNYPNPFNPITNINYELPITNYVDLSIYNLLGQKVATLVDSKQPAGSYQVQWDAGGFASGIYICKLQTMDNRQKVLLTKKIVLLR
jgi:hypothetical protein